MSIYPSNDETVSEKRRKTLARLLQRMKRDGGSLGMIPPRYDLVAILEKRKAEIAACEAEAQGDGEGGANEIHAPSGKFR